MIKLTDVAKAFGEKTVLRNLNLHFAEGETSCILGPSGCGKSTLLRVASGLTRPDSGKVHLLDSTRRSYVFQENRLLPWADCLENICYTGAPLARAKEYLARVGLEKEERRLPRELSGGMLRRLVIARALAFGGNCFFLDEPLQGLDANTRRDMVSLIKEACKGKTALIITHSAKEAYTLADRILIVKGIPLTVVEDCKGKDLFSAEDIAARIRGLSGGDERPQ